MACSPTPGTVSLAEHVQRQIRTLATQLAREASLPGLNASDSRALVELARFADGTSVSATELARHADLTKSAASRVVRKLVDAGLATRDEVDGDRRLHAIAITAHGRTLLASPGRTAPHGVREAFDALAEQDQLALARILDRCVAAIPQPA